LTQQAELAARIHALLRRANPNLVTAALKVGDLELDRTTHRVRRAARDVHLGPTEYRLLEYLMRHPGRVYSREQLLDGVWGNDVYVDERTVDVHIGRLRRAINRGRETDPIRTVRGAGYAFDERFAGALVSAMAGDSHVRTARGGEVRFLGSERLRAQQLPTDAPTQRVGREQSNTSLSLGDSMVLKILRRIEPGIHPELEVSRFLTEAGFRNTPTFLGGVELLQDGMQERLAPEVEAGVYRIVQEALTNVAKHAKATTCRVFLQRLPNTVLVTIEDDGIGFRPEEVSEPGAARGIGLVGIRERVAQLRGELRLEASPGKGTRLTVEIPVRSRELEAVAG